MSIFYVWYKLKYSLNKHVYACCFHSSTDALPRSYHRVFLTGGEREARIRCWWRGWLIDIIVNIFFTVTTTRQFAQFTSHDENFIFSQTSQWPFLDNYALSPSCNNCSVVQVFIYICFSFCCINYFKTTHSTIHPLLNHFSFLCLSLFSTGLIEFFYCACLDDIFKREIFLSEEAIITKIKHW